MQWMAPSLLVVFLATGTCPAQQSGLCSGAIFPIGIITSLVGVPFFLSLILAKRRQLW